MQNHNSNPKIGTQHFNLTQNKVFKTFFIGMFPRVAIVMVGEINLKWEAQKCWIKNEDFAQRLECAAPKRLRNIQHGIQKRYLEAS